MSGTNRLIVRLFDMSSYLECAKVLNTHGYKGVVKVESFCNTPEDLLDIETVYTKVNDQFVPHQVLGASVFKQWVLLTLEDVTTMEAAEALKNQMLYADKDLFELDENEYFEADVIGLKVVDLDTQQVYGTIADVDNRGAQDLYIVKTPKGEVFLPAVDQFIARVVPNEAVYVTPIPGLFTDEI